MVFLRPIPHHQTNIVIAVRYWRQSEIDWTNYFEEEEVFIPGGFSLYQIM
jgi:hypothetical protein